MPHLRLLFYLLGFTLQLYARILGWEASAAARHAVWILFAAGGLSFIFCAPPFYHSLLGLPFTGWVRGLFFALDVLAAAAALANLLFPGLLLAGFGGRDIGKRLFISPKTVENHVYNIYQKLGVKNRVQLFRLIRANALE